jgi:hypothetical protein
LAPVTASSSISGVVVMIVLSNPEPTHPSDRVGLPGDPPQAVPGWIWRIALACGRRPRCGRTPPWLNSRRVLRLAFR